MLNCINIEDALKRMNGMLKPKLSIFVALVSTVLPVFGEPSDGATKPNIVFIITDDQSWDTLSFTGGDVHTPFLDKMKSEGMYFSNFNVTSTVCSPSRYTFLTGRYAGRSRGKHFMDEHPPGDQTQIENIGEIEPETGSL